MEINNKWKEFLTLSKKDRIGLTIMGILILGMCTLTAIRKPEEQWIQNLSDPRLEKEWTAFLEQESTPKENKQQDSTLSPSPSGPLFYFDPNSLSEQGWRSLGLPGRIAKTILKYRAKGGRFKEAEDLERIFGFPPELAKKLQPYVQIRRETQAAQRQSTAFALPARRPAVILVDVNMSDSIGFESLPGIGPRLAQRIIRFRESLGGFYEVDQVKEVYGLADSVFNRIKPLLRIQTTTVSQLNINEGEEKELARHPYIGKLLAKLIVTYRQEHGEWKDINDLLHLPGITTEKLRKLTPYLFLKTKSSS